MKNGNLHIRIPDALKEALKKRAAFISKKEGYRITLSSLVERELWKMLEGEKK